MGAVVNEAVVGTERKNGHQVRKISVADYGNKPYIYARIYSDDPLPPGVEERHPGLTLRPDTARELLPLLDQELEVAEIREKASWDQGEEPRRRRR